MINDYEVMLFCLDGCKQFQIQIKFYRNAETVVKRTKQ